MLATQTSIADSVILMARRRFEGGAEVAHPALGIVEERMLFTS
jgi:hypothetical protein